jgi:predicted RecA/RadA family phage recombinase
MATKVLRAGYGVGVLVGVLVCVALALPRGTAHHGSDDAAVNVPKSWARPVVTRAELAQRVGVEITQVAISGDGGLVDLRYRVTDPDAASSVHDPATPPAIVDEGSGLVVHDLLMNHAHSGKFKAGVTYYLVFDNPGNWLRRGASVSVLLGAAQVEHVVLQ